MYPPQGTPGLRRWSSEAPYWQKCRFETDLGTILGATQAPPNLLGFLLLRKSHHLSASFGTKEVPRHIRRTNRNERPRSWEGLDVVQT